MFISINRRKLVFSILLYLCSNSLWASDVGSGALGEKSLKDKIAHLNAFSREHLGIEINALALLLNTSRGNLLLRDSLKESGQMVSLEQLKRHSFIKVREVETMQGIFVEIVATPKGEIVKAAVLNQTP